MVLHSSPDLLQLGSRQAPVAGLAAAATMATPGLQTVPWVDKALELGRLLHPGAFACENA